MIRMETRDGVVLLDLNRGATNPLSSRLLTEFRAAVKVVRGDADIRGLVLTSVSGKFLSIGFDIPELYPLKREGMREFFKLFNEVCIEFFTLPIPTVAAVNGHAVAGGCILALVCDRRIIAEGRTLMGLNEVKLGVPVPCIADRIVRDLAGNRHARRILEEGEFHPPEELMAFGLVDRILPAEEVLDASLAEASRLGALPADAFAAIKRERTREIVAYVERRQAEMEREFLNGWYSPATRAQLKAAMERY